MKKRSRLVILRAVSCLGLFVALLGVPLLAQPGKQGQVNHQELTHYLDESGKLVPIKTEADWQKRKAAVLENLQKVMGPLPKQATEKLAPKYKVLAETQGDGYTRKTISLEALPGAPVIADLYLPEKQEGKRAGIVALHPTGELGKRIVAGEGPKSNRQYALELAQRGYVVIAPDYPGYGDLKDYDFAGDEYVSGTMKGIVNHMRCVDLLQSLEQVDGEKIGVIGHSLGGHNAMFLAAFDDRVKVIVSSCGWTNLSDYHRSGREKGDVNGWGQDVYMPLVRSEYASRAERLPFDFPEIIASFAPRPFLSCSPIDDDNFSVEGVRKGMASAQKIYDLLGASDKLKLDEPFSDHDFPTEVRSDAYKFIDEALGHTALRELDFAADLPRLPGLNPEQAMKSLQIAENFQVQLAASEPVVVDPVALSFDEKGGVYVVEMRGYSEDGGENLDQIRYLEDTDQDGVYDKFTIFAEGLSWPTAVISYDGGIFVGAAPHIYYMKDTDGDGKADVQKLVYTGFGNRNVQALINSFRWGLDNRIHGATSANGGIVKRPEDPDSKAINLSGRNFSFNPKTLEMRPESGSSQHGMSFDDWGRQFVCSNSDHFQMVMYADRYAARNPYLKAPPARISIADDGAQAVVYRISPVEPWRIVRTRLRASGRVKGAIEHGGKNSGYFTSATGINFMRGDAWSEKDKGTALVGDVGSNLVHRKRVYEDGVQLRGARIDVESEIVASTDTWFRPVQYENGPDGAMYLLDMYRETIEHPWSLPPEIKQHLDLTSGRDRGRLYRLAPVGYKHRPTPNLLTYSAVQLVDLLDHPNAWHRETASRLLYQAVESIQKNSDELNGLVKLITDEKYGKFSDIGKMHLLYVLAGLEKLSPEMVLKALNSEEPQLRRHGVILSEKFVGDKAIQAKLAELVQDPSLAVRYQLAFTLGEFPAEWNAPYLAALLKSDGNSSWVRFAALSSVKDQYPAILESLSSSSGFFKSATARPVLTALAELIAQRSIQADVDSFAQFVLGSDQLSQAEKQALYRTYATNVPRRNTAPVSTPALDEWQKNFLVQARSVIENRELPVARRADAIGALTVSRDAQDVELLLQLLDQREAETIQLAALNTLVVLGAAGTDSHLITNWTALGPQLRKQAQQALFSRPAWTINFLKAILADEIPRADVDRAQLQVQINSKTKEIAELCKQVIERLQDSPRTAVIEKYRPALEIEGNIDKGRVSFVKHCSSCHLLEGQGKPIGPNLAGFKNRGKEAFLINMLDPSREVTPDYLSYLVVMEDGRTYTGLLAAQSATSISLQRAEGEPITLLRSEIEEMRSSGISLMPEGLEKDLDVADMADLLTYLMQTE